MGEKDRLRGLSGLTSSDRQSFQPFISADKMLPEFTGTALVIGVLLSVIFGAANAYLGLKVGMTISASIPAAVISMGVIRVILKKESILENNMVQTIGSAGESLAAGAIFTLPALFIWMDEWGLGAPSLLMITSIALCGGLLGVFFMVPLRKALIVKEHEVLPFPEGTACAEVLLAGEEGGKKAAATFTGLGIGAVYKFLTGGLKLFPDRIEVSLPVYKNAAVGMDCLPALLGVGFIIGPTLSAYMLAGAVLGWIVLIPLISNIGSLGYIVMFPADVPIQAMDYWDIWDMYIRYIGAGAVAFGGIFGLIKSLPLIAQTFVEAMRDYASTMGDGGTMRTDRDMNMRVVLFGSLTVVILMAVLPFIEVGFGGAILIAVFGFFFATVSSRIVGLVGSSSNPVSGMTIATLIITGIIYKATGNDGQSGMIATLTVGAIICIIAAMAGDTSQDLKTGFLVGATPYRQQYGELVGAVASALAIGVVMTWLNNAWGFGSSDLPAPQATLMRLVVEGVIGGNLPWALVFTGVGIGLALELLGLPVLPVSIGLYLPIHLSTPIVAGSLIRGFLDKKMEDDERTAIRAKSKVETGVLYASGLIAGEGLIGILLAIFAALELNLALGLSLGALGTIGFFGLLIYTLMRYSIFARHY